VADENGKKRKINKIIVGIVLFAVAIAMYVTIILKIKYIGP
jgi:hypothetical protein